MNGDSKIKQKIGFIGGGNMAKAIAGGIVNKGLVSYSQIYVSGPRLENLAFWRERGTNIFQENGKVVSEADVIFLCVKPYMLSVAVEDALKGADKNCKGKLFLSILAGITLNTLEEHLAKFEDARIIRIMSNTPMLVGAGSSVFAPGKKVMESDISLLKTLLAPLGLCEQIPESLMNAVTAVAGSGPAFIYLMIEALSDGGVKMGIPRELACKLATQTFFGAAKMVQETGKHTGVLKDEVCSPGGTTIEGIFALEKGGLRGVIMQAVETAANKAGALANKNK